MHKLYNYTVSGPWAVHEWWQLAAVCEMQPLCFRMGGYNVNSTYYSTSASQLQGEHIDSLLQCLTTAWWLWPRWLWLHAGRWNPATDQTNANTPHSRNIRQIEQKTRYCPLNCSILDYLNSIIWVHMCACAWGWFTDWQQYVDVKGHDVCSSKNFFRADFECAYTLDEHSHVWREYLYIECIKPNTVHCSPCIRIHSASSHCSHAT